jgi:hypothetical protein
VSFATVDLESFFDMSLEERTAFVEWLVTRTSKAREHLVIRVDATPDDAGLILRLWHLPIDVWNERARAHEPWTLEDCETWLERVP